MHSFESNMWEYDFAENDVVYFGQKASFALPFQIISMGYMFVAWILYKDRDIVLGGFGGYLWLRTTIL